MSSVKHAMKQLMLNFDSIGSSMQDFFLEFMKPYQ